jgi:hypothetical protein
VPVSVPICVRGPAILIQVCLLIKKKKKKSERRSQALVSSVGLTFLGLTFKFYLDVIIISQVKTLVLLFTFPELAFVLCYIFFVSYF